MSYIGNSPIISAFPSDQYSGNGSTTAFTLSIAPANTASVIVVVSGILQDPTTYSVSGTTLTFSAAPPTGTNNISVRYLGIPAAGVVNTAFYSRNDYTATAGQTTFSVPSYTVPFIQVLRNGVTLGTADYTATSGTSVVLANAATAGDLITVISFFVSSVLNAIPNNVNSVSDSNILAVSASKLSGQVPYTNQPAGSVLQVVSAIKTDTASTTSTTFTDISGLSVSITPKSASNKMLILLSVVGANSTYGAFVRLCRDSTGIALGNTNGSRTVTSIGNFYNPDQNTTVTGAINYLDSPTTTSPITYKAQFRNGNGTGTALINMSPNNIDAAYTAAPVSTITVMEIAA